MLAPLGIRQVEGFGGVYDDPAAFRALLDKNGLSMPSGHFSIDILENDFGKAKEICSTFGISKVVCPYLMPADRPTDADGWRRFGRRLAAIGKSVTAAGFSFGWHNHNFEFAPLADGEIPMALILESAPQIEWEADIAWIVRGGADPLEWIAMYGKRITAVHVKDIAPEGECADEDGWADVGYGYVAWRNIVRELKASTPASLYILEHDNPNDVDRFARRSIETLRTLVE